MVVLITLKKNILFRFLNMFKNTKYSDILGVTSLIGLYGAYRYFSGTIPETKNKVIVSNKKNIKSKKREVLASYSNDLNSNSDSEYEESSISESSDDYVIKFDEVSEYEYE